MIRQPVVAAVVACLLLSGNAFGQEDLKEIRPDSVHIIIPTEYPGFDVENAADRARTRGVRPLELRAVVQRTDPWDYKHPVIILNPAHADIHTLYAALRHLRRSTELDAVVTGRQSRVQAPAAAAFELQRILRNLRSREVELIMRIAGMGQYVVIDGAALSVWNLGSDAQR